MSTETELVDLKNTGHEPQLTRITSSQQESNIALEEFKQRLGVLRVASVLAAVMHVVTTLMTFVCAFTKGIPTQIIDENGVPVVDENDEPVMTNPYISEALVITAFGCLNTCVFAIVETWKTIEGTSNTELPSWHWHNDAFMTSVGNMYFLCLFSLPSVVVYILHSIGYQFFGELAQTRSTQPGLFGVIMYHLFSSAFVFAVDGCAIVISTRKLQMFQTNSNEDERKGESKAEKEETENDEGREEENRPVEAQDRWFALLTLVAHTAFVIDLIILSARSSNSGSVSSCVIMTIMLLFWFIFAWKGRKMTEVTESWLLNFRLATIGHVFAFLLFFWITLSVLLLTEVNGKAGFYQTLSDIAQTHPNNAAIASLLIIAIFVSVIVHGVILYVHSRSMWSLDEIASLILAAKLQAKLAAEMDMM